MQPLQKFQKSLKLLRSLYKLIGQDVFTKEFRRGYIFYTICLLELCLILFLSIDLVGMDGLEESYRVIQACMLIGVIQILIKYYLLIDLHILRPIVISLEDIYRKNSQLTDEYYGICQRYARITELMFMITAGSYMGLVAFISIASALESSPKMQPVLYAYFPFVHEYSLLQLIVLDTFISLICSVNVFVMPAGDLSIYILAANLTMFPLIISMQMDELSTRLQLGRANVREIKRRWMHYILIHHEYVSLLRLLEGCVYKYCIIQFLTSSVFTILGVSAMSQETTFLLYTVAAMGVFQLGAYCALGTVVEHSSNRIYDALFLVKWYELPLVEQRVYHQLLLHAQQPQIIYIAGIKPLNMETYLATLRTIYSYGMIFAAMI